MRRFPIYFIPYNTSWLVSFPDTESDMSHQEFWSVYLSPVLSKRYKCNPAELAKLYLSHPYGTMIESCICLSLINDSLVKAINTTFKNETVVLVQDRNHLISNEHLALFKQLAKGKNLWPNHLKLEKE